MRPLVAFTVLVSIWLTTCAEEPVAAQRPPDTRAPGTSAPSTEPTTAAPSSDANGPDHRIVGRCVDRAGRPLEGVRVEFWPDDEVRGGLPGWTHSDGRFEIYSTIPTHGDLVVCDDDFTPALVADRNTADASHDVGDIELRPGTTLTGCVRDPAGQPKPHVRVSVLGPSHHAHARQTWATADGDFEIPHLGSEQHRVRVDFPLDVAWVHPLDWFDPGGNDSRAWFASEWKDVDVRTPQTLVTGDTVTAALRIVLGRAAITDASSDWELLVVTCRPASGEGPSHEAVYPAGATPDFGDPKPDSVWLAHVATAGTYDITVAADSFAPTTLRGIEIDGRERTPIDVTLNANE